MEQSNVLALKTNKEDSVADSCSPFVIQALSCTDDYCKKIYGVKLSDLHRLNGNEDAMKRITAFVCLQLTGKENPPYAHGMMRKMFRRGYHFAIEWNWVVANMLIDISGEKHTDDEEKECITTENYPILEDIDVAASLHRVYFNLLWRCADVRAVEDFLRTVTESAMNSKARGCERRSDGNKEEKGGAAAATSAALDTRLHRLSAEIITSPEHASVTWLKAYLKDEEQGRDLEPIMEAFVKHLYYTPRKSHFMLYRKRVKKGGECVTEDDVVKDVQNWNDYKYLNQCRDRFSRLANLSTLPARKFVKHAIHDENSVSVQKSRAAVKYYGPVGTSGYAKMTRNIVESLYHASDVDLEFEVVQFHNYNETSEDDALLSALSKCRLSHYDYVMIHSPPDLWPAICKRERRINPDVRVYGITVWETDALPPRWSAYLRYVDKVSVPSEFSALAMRKDGIDVDVVHHPVLDAPAIFTDNDEDAQLFARSKSLTCTSPLYDMLQTLRQKPSTYVFYNISEWTNRKGVSELIESFIHEFSEDDDALLYVKTYGDVGEKDAKAFIRHVSGNRINSVLNRIILDYGRVDDAYIDILHAHAHCYVSTCKAEGHGVGMCYAALNGKPVIVTGFSGHVDYLRCVDFIDYTLEPATYCTPWLKKHARCRLLPHCACFEGFVPAQQRWALPDVEDCRAKMRTRFDKRQFLNDEEQEREKESAQQRRSFILENFDAKSRASHFLRSLFSTKQVNPRDRRAAIKEAIDKDGDGDAAAPDLSPQGRFFEFKGLRRKNVIVVASYGYGNVGDDAYESVIRKVLEENEQCRVFMVPDTCLLLRSGELVPVDEYGKRGLDGLDGLDGVKDLNDSINDLCMNMSASNENGNGEDPRQLMPFDCVIVGGGGLLTIRKFSFPRNSINIYSSLARAMKKPYYALSLGFQDVEAHVDDESLKHLRADRNINAFLNGAQFVSMRSILDYRIAASIMRKETVGRLSYHPDLVYALASCFRRSRRTSNQFDDEPNERNVILVIVTDWINIRRKVLIRDLEYELREGDELVFMDWDGVTENENYLFTDEVKTVYPQAKCLGGKVPELPWLRRHGGGGGEGRTVSMSELWELLLRTRVMFTGRYHGIVIGKTAGVCRIETYGSMNYKFEADRLSTHPSAVCKDLERRALLPLIQIRYLIVQDVFYRSDTWTEDDRNTAIARLNDWTGIDIEMLQNLSNARLEEEYVMKSE